MNGMGMLAWPTLPRARSQQRTWEVIKSEIRQVRAPLHAVWAVRALCCAAALAALGLLVGLLASWQSRVREEQKIAGHMQKA